VFSSVNSNRRERRATKLSGGKLLSSHEESVSGVFTVQHINIIWQ
jgi:hypothetical protein